MKNEEEHKKNGFWHPNSFIQSLNKEESEARIKTIDNRHDENMNFNCKICNEKISEHNKDWHDNMCDDCFNKKYFNEDEFEELDNAEQEAIELAGEIFENEIWKKMKQDLKEDNRKGACKSMFSLGFLTYLRMMDEQVANFDEKIKNNPEEFEEAIKKIKKSINRK